MTDPDRRRSPDGFDDDAIFADIVAHLLADAAEVEPARPPDKNPPSQIESTDQPAEETAPDPAEGSTAAVPPQVWRAREVDDANEEHFEPPPISPLPAGDLQFWAIIVGMCGGPLLLLYLVFFNRSAGSLWVLAAIAMSVAGFALLVARMPGHDEENDDGARL